jgi:hypothetical protein
MGVQTIRRQCLGDGCGFLTLLRHGWYLLGKFKNRRGGVKVGEMSAEDLVALVSEALDPKIENVGYRVMEEIEKRLESIDKRFDKVELRLSGIDLRTQTLEKGQKSGATDRFLLKGTANVIEHQLAAFQSEATKKLDLVKDQVDGFYRQNEALQQEYEAMSHQMDELAKKVA